MIISLLPFSWKYMSLIWTWKRFILSLAIPKLPGHFLQKLCQTQMYWSFFYIKGCILKSSNARGNVPKMCALNPIIFFQVSGDLATCKEETRLMKVKNLQRTVFLVDFCWKRISSIKRTEVKILFFRNFDFWKSCLFFTCHARNPEAGKEIIVFNANILGTFPQMFNLFKIILQCRHIANKSEIRPGGDTREKNTCFLIVKN